VLVSPSRFGKTAWARSLGDHAYLNGGWCVDAIRPGAKYLIFDDIQWEHAWPRFKPFFGGQGSITVSGKYRAPRVVQWGRPFMFLCNGDNDPLTKLDYGSAEWDWFIANTVHIVLSKPLFN